MQPLSAVIYELLGGLMATFHPAANSSAKRAKPETDPLEIFYQMFLKGPEEVAKPAKPSKALASF